MEKKISKAEEKIFKEVDAVEDITKIVKRLTAIKEIGKLTAITILVFMPENGTLGRKRAAALAGLAPYADDSGKDPKVVLTAVMRKIIALQQKCIKTVAGFHEP